MKTIAIFGSAQVEPEHEDYRAAMIIGRLLAQAGYAVMTGGYKGVMEAASRGAAEVGGQVIGVTTAQIEMYSGARANPWVTKEVKHPLIRDRLRFLVEHGDGYIAMPGGVGTLHEIAETWELMRINGVPRRPMVCYGPHWAQIIGLLNNSPYVHQSYRELLSFAHTPEEAVALIFNHAAM